MLKALGNAWRASRPVRISTEALEAVRYAVSNPAAGIVTLHTPDYVEPSNEDAELVARIFRAYARMKRDQARAPAVFLPSSMWELAEAYAPLRSALTEDKLEDFQFFLANFGAWEQYTGITWSTTLREARSFRERRALENETFYKLFKLWQWFYGGRKPASALEHPHHGNQSGAYVEGTFVTISSFPLEVYGSLLAGIAQSSRERPIVAELGAGYGILAYYFLSHLEHSTFVDFDLPETLCVAAYFLLKSFPEKRALLYGEADYDPGLHSDFDLVLLPNWEVEKIGHGTVDMFLNYASLGEMTGEAVNRYVALIANATRYFFHVNHDRIRNVYDDGSEGLLSYEYPLPPEFDLLFRFPELFITTMKGKIDLESDSFAYLYRRRTPGL